jgi:hypothetical protein
VSEEPQVPREVRATRVLLVSPAQLERRAFPALQSPVLQVKQVKLVRLAQRMELPDRQVQPEKPESRVP